MNTLYPCDGSSRFVSALIIVSLAATLSAPLAAQTPPSDRGKSAAEREVEIVAAARQAARRDDDRRLDAELRAMPASEETAAASVVLARRTAALCAWLRNDNEGERAARFAQRTIQQLSSMEEANDADRVERLYWEAWLEAEMLGHRRRALALLQAAEKLAPNDDRILATQLQLAQALAEFGE